MRIFCKRLSLAYLRTLFRWQTIAPVYCALLLCYYGLTALFSLPRSGGLGLYFYLIACAALLCAVRQLIFTGRALARWRCGARLLLFTVCLFPLWLGLAPFLGFGGKTALFFAAGFAALLTAEGLAVAAYEGFSRMLGRRYDRRLREYQTQRSTDQSQ